MISLKRKNFLLKLYHKKLSNLGTPADIISIIDTGLDAFPQYVQWTIVQYINNPFPFPQLILHKALFEKFEELKSLLPSKDINYYKSFNDLANNISNVSNSSKPISNKQKKKQIKDEGTKLVFETSRFKVIQLLTIDAVLLYDRGTTWCTNANNNFFDFYKSSDDIFLILVEGRKFQFHFASEELRNENDKQITQEEIDLLSKYEEYTFFLNMMIERYYKV